MMEDYQTAVDSHQESRVQICLEALEIKASRQAILIVLLRERTWSMAGRHTLQCVCVMINTGPCTMELPHNNSIIHFLNPF